MARPIKNGLDYFPMDVDTDEKFELIEAKHGLIGFGMVVKILQRIYKSGYYLEWNEEKLLIFKKSVNVDINLISDVINDCLRYGIFDENLFKKYKILTSNGIQKRYLGACDRRKSLELVKEYVIADINHINVDIIWINTHISTQSKVKESKVKEITNNWRENFEIYLDEISKEYNALLLDSEFLKQQEEFYPNVDIKLSLKKAYTQYWATQAGWKKKKANKSIEPDWKRTFANAISINKVYKSNEFKNKPTTILHQPEYSADGRF